MKSLIKIMILHIVFNLCPKLLFAQSIQDCQAISNFSGFFTIDTICIGDTITLTIVPPPTMLPPYVFSWDGLNTWSIPIHYSSDNRSVTTIVNSSGLGLWAFNLEAYSSVSQARATCRNTKFVVGYYCPPIPAFTADRTQLCGSGCVQFQPTVRHAPTAWHWSFEGGIPATYDGNTPPPVCYDAPGRYAVSLWVSNPAGKDSLTRTDYITVTQAPTFTADTMERIETDLGQSTPLRACAVGNDYQWSPPAGLSCTTCATPMASPAVTTDYTCRISTGGCAVKCHYQVAIRPAPDYVYFPNAFTPDYDGRNDRFAPVGTNFQLLNLAVFNRWGQQVYSSPDPAGWDGTVGGKHCPAGIYAYYVQWRNPTTGTVKQQSGTVALVE